MGLLGIGCPLFPVLCSFGGGLRVYSYGGLRENTYFSKLVPLLFGRVAFRFVCLSCQSQLTTKNKQWQTQSTTAAK